ncbi:MAG TPA: hypothetical protein VJM50_18365 [Pyrinomonadaceae bacterium]|nr:hypothetical protein [Pyrinomonadaceae bacterium]
MKRIAITLFITLLFSPSTAFSQTRGRSTRQRPPATPPAQRVSQVRTQGAQRVAEQIKHLTRFVYVLGGVNSGIATSDEQIRRNEAPPNIVQQNQQNKVLVKTTIQNFRIGLDKLEIDFRAAPELQPFYIKLAGVAAGAATAEELAGANQFDRAGRTLLDVVNRLADVLVIMRQ